MLCIQVDPDKTELVNVDMNFEKAIGGLVETGKLLILRGLCQPSVKAVRPT